MQQAKRFCTRCDVNAKFTCVETTRTVRVWACNCCTETVTVKRRISAKAKKLEATLQWLLAN